MATSVSTTPRPLTASIAVPPTPNTAPVLEFRCLYTSDLRRKQKRWQDGRLKYHTFNKRVMVYDERSNFIGDTHWREDYAFDEGEEVELERGGILVEVSECIGRREQDLSELLDKRAKERIERNIARETISSPLQAPPSSRLSSHSGPSRLQLQLQNPIRRLQGPSLPSRFTPQTSAAQLTETHNPPESKRRRLDNSPAGKSGYAQNLTGATLSLSTPPMSSTPRRQEALGARTSRQQQQIGSDLKNNGQNTGEIVATVNRVTKRLEKPPSERGTYATKLSGAVLTLSNDSPTQRCAIAKGPKVPDVSHYKIISELQTENQTISDDPKYTECVEDDHSLDTDISDTEDLRQTNQPLHQNIDRNVTTSHIPLKPRMKKPSEKLSTRQPVTESQQKVAKEDERQRKSFHEQPSNPLRLKSRPKKKLLSMSDHYCWYPPPIDTSSRSPTPTIKLKQVRSARYDTTTLQAQERQVEPCQNRENESELHVSRRKLSRDETGVDKGLAMNGELSHLLDGHGSLQSKGEKCDRMLSKVSQDSETYQSVRPSHYSSIIPRDFTAAARGSPVLPSLRKCSISDPDIHPSHETQYAWSEVDSQENPEGENDASAKYNGIDHITIDALLSRHVSEEPIIRTVDIVANQTRKQAKCVVPKNSLPHVPQESLRINGPALLKTGASLGVPPHELIGLHISRDPCVGLPLPADDYSEVESVRSSKSMSSSNTCENLTKKCSPRVIKTSNNSAHSKEVIGFVLPGQSQLRNQGDLEQNTNGTSEQGIQTQPELSVKLTNHTTDAPIKIADKLSDQEGAFYSQLPAKLRNPETDTLRQTINNLSALEGQTCPQLPAKLVNPATRGKKAASKADAAGKVPESVVPPIAPMAPPPRPILRKRTFSLQHAVGSNAGPTPAKEVGETGPWSREAFDLFDWTPQVASVVD